jgi:hypothetical protein
MLRYRVIIIMRNKKFQGCQQRKQKPHHVKFMCKEHCTISSVVILRFVRTSFQSKVKVQKYCSHTVRDVMGVFPYATFFGLKVTDYGKVIVLTLSGVTSTGTTTIASDI